MKYKLSFYTEDGYVEYTYDMNQLSDMLRYYMALLCNPTVWGTTWVLTK